MAKGDWNPHRVSAHLLFRLRSVDLPLRAQISMTTVSPWLGRINIWLQLQECGTGLQGYLKFHDLLGLSPRFKWLCLLAGPWVCMIILSLWLRASRAKLQGCFRICGWTRVKDPASEHGQMCLLAGLWGYDRWTRAAEARPQAMSGSTFQPWDQGWKACYLWQGWVCFLKGSWQIDLVVGITPNRVTRLFPGLYLESQLVILLPGHEPIFSKGPPQFWAPLDFTVPYLDPKAPELP